MSKYSLNIQRDEITSSYYKMFSFVVVLGIKLRALNMFRQVPYH